MLIRWAVVGLLLVPIGRGHAQEVFSSTFDQSLDPWEGYGVTVDSLDYRVARGGASLRIDGSGTVFTNVYLPDDLEGLFRLTGYVRTSGSSTGRMAIAGLTGRCVAGSVPGPVPKGSEWTFFRLDVLPSPEVRRVEVQAVAEGDGSTWFDDVTVELVGRDELPPASDDVLAFLDAALDTIQLHVLHREQVDWAHVREEARRRIRGATRACEAWSSIEQVFEDIGERHGWHQTPAEVSWYENNGAQRQDFSIPSMRLTDRAGYLSVPGLPSTHAGTVERFAAELQTHIDALASQGVCRWVLDLRDNTGGNMWPMLAGVGWILGEGKAGAFRGTAQVDSWGLGRDGAYLNSEIKVRAPARPTHMAGEPPVAVLYGPRTASSGEAVAVAFRGRGLARSFGQSTMGVSTSTEAFSLSDGSRLVFATSVFEDRGGVAYGGPLVPDVEVDSPRSEDPRDDTVVGVALRWLESQPCDGVR